MKVPLVLPSPVQQHLRRFSENFTRCLHDELCEELKDVIIPQPKTQSCIGIGRALGEKEKERMTRSCVFKNYSRTLLGVLGRTLTMTRPLLGSGIRS